MDTPKAKVLIDVDHNFLRLQDDGSYSRVATPHLENKRAWSTVRVFRVTEETEVQVLKNGALVSMHAQTGDMVLIFPEGDHKVVPPERQKYITD